MLIKIGKTVVCLNNSLEVNIAPMLIAEQLNATYCIQIVKSIRFLKNRITLEGTFQPSSSQYTQIFQSGLSVKQDCLEMLHSLATD